MAHAREMKSSVPESPIVFMKPSTALIKKNGPFLYPAFSDDVHYEGEVVFRFGKTGKLIDHRSAWDYISHITMGIDFTARDIQSQCKANGHPWEVAKSFDGSAAVGEFIAFDASAIREWSFKLTRNGDVVQEGSTSQMVFDVPFLVQFISERFTIEAGDLLFTGTPEGVGSVQPGDRLEGWLEERKLLSVMVR